jgi:deoxyadenosine/deoxycytidine kinase
MLICFEGPSAIGKTTLCQTFAQDYNIIPEANVLFPTDPSKYLQYQLQRYALAAHAGKPSILDGDIFQPLWYNWTYKDTNLEAIFRFYRTSISLSQIRFPHCYILFYTDLEELKRRKEHDTTRQRRNFDKHLALIKSQQEYFTFINEHTNIPVAFILYTTVEETRQRVVAYLATLKRPGRDDESILPTISTLLL